MLSDDGGMPQKRRRAETISTTRDNLRVMFESLSEIGRIYREVYKGETLDALALRAGTKRKKFLWHVESDDKLRTRCFELIRDEIRTKSQLKRR